MHHCFPIIREYLLQNMPIKKEIEFLKELEPYLALNSSENMKKAHIRLCLHLKKLSLEQEFSAQSRSSRGDNVIVIPTENLDNDAIFNENLPFAENDLAGNYGIGLKEGIKEFFGDNLPTFQTCETANLLIDTKPKMEQVTEGTGFVEVKTDSNPGHAINFDEAFESELNNLAFELFNR